jgi:predicted DNA-binding antitoxin AbrB/MazE fold protein
MSLEVQATYEDGVLKPDKPLPLEEHSRVIVSVKQAPFDIGDSAGIVPWNGDLKALDELLGPDNRP